MFRTCEKCVRVFRAAQKQFPHNKKEFVGCARARQHVAVHVDGQLFLAKDATRFVRAPRQNAFDESRRRHANAEKYA